MVRRILVTGANKGIGLAIVRRCMLDHSDTHCILACRSIQRGEAAVASLLSEDPAWKERLTVLEMDTASDASVAAAAATLTIQLGASSNLLYGYVNNAGIAAGTLAEILNVNVRGPRRVDCHFLRLLDPDAGRVVQMASGVATFCVSKCSDERKAFLTHPHGQDWASLDSLIEEVLAYPNGAKDLAPNGFGPAGYGYGLSKALLNAYTLGLARQHPNLKINSCSPGLIATDLFGDFIAEPFASWGGRAVSKILARWLAGALTPDEGTVSAMYLLFSEELETLPSGRYYGSDAKRSPLDVYEKQGARRTRARERERTAGWSIRDAPAG
eukprot:CAMPEP_0183338282 /NCGR_PEP_ID=MMETSP0164_2-20130417/5629_1 /TAXON_ID=221442 /ORGANISM="Coccolithus pelagicus ssp braarudi, Strain PLY182g" /LENGTH=326 /DNA_ID=CAMNT_0025508103 /DNA_START=13 /DNA_END=990 /DNA_ORIENTATION=+